MSIQANYLTAARDALQIFEDHSEGCDEIQRRIVEVQSRPSRAKRLRLIPTPEAARLLQVSESHLRALVRQNGFPAGTIIGGNNRRAFSLQEVNAVRKLLFNATRDTRYEAGRRNRTRESLA